MRTRKALYTALAAVLALGIFATVTAKQHGNKGKKKGAVKTALTGIVDGEEKTVGHAIFNTTAPGNDVKAGKTAHGKLMATIHLEKAPPDSDFRVYVHQSADYQEEYIPEPDDWDESITTNEEGKATVHVKKDAVENEDDSTIFVQAELVPDLGNRFSSDVEEVPLKE